MKSDSIWLVLMSLRCNSVTVQALPSVCVPSSTPSCHSSIHHVASCHDIAVMPPLSPQGVSLFRHNQHPSRCAGRGGGLRQLLARRCCRACFFLVRRARAVALSVNGASASSADIAWRQCSSRLCLQN